ncbi:MAG: hypothetical protein JST23_08035 [Bacteroidetes bacterium]|nr:hypothetical protein [Bacteroidota bacterium]
MLNNQFISRLIMFAFLVLVGFAIAMGIYYGSFWGIFLALIALGAGIYFINLLAKAKREIMEAEVKESMETL